MGWIVPDPLPHDINHLADMRWRSGAHAATGVTHLLLDPVTRYAEQVEVLAELVGLAMTDR